MSDLTLLLDDLISCGNKLTETAQALKDHYSAPAPAEDEIPDISKFVSHEKATTSLGDLLKNIKLD